MRRGFKVASLGRGQFIYNAQSPRGTKGNSVVTLRTWIPSKLCIDLRTRAGLLSPMLKRLLKWFLGIVGVLLLVIADLRDQRDLVSALEPERLLRKGFRGGAFSKSRSCSPR